MGAYVPSAPHWIRACIIEYKNSRDFWKDVNKIKKGKNVLPNTMDKVEECEAICKVLAEKFKRVYNSVSYDDGDMEVLLRDIDVGVREKCSMGLCKERHVITLEEVEMGMKKLKKGKSDSIQGLKTDNFIQGVPG